MQMGGRRKTVKEIPFAVDRRSAISLVDQVAEGFRRAIRTGYYGSGDFLPPVDAIAEGLGVSRRIPLEVMRRLAAENLVSPRPRVGCMVLGETDVRWRGQILLILPEESVSSFYASVLLRDLMRELQAAGYLTDIVPLAFRDGKYDFSLLDEKLRSRVLFAFTIWVPKGACERLERAHVPYAGVCSRDASTSFHPICGFANSHERALSALIADCRSASVSDVLVLQYVHSMIFCRELRDVGFHLETISVPARKGFGYLGLIRSAAMKAVLGHFNSRSRKLPDLVLSTDDVVSEGALMAFASLGFESPRDFGFVTFATVGNVPLYPRELTRILYDPQSEAKDLARAAIRFLKGDSARADVISELKYVRGETFG